METETTIGIGIVTVIVTGHATETGTTTVVIVVTVAVVTETDTVGAMTIIQGKGITTGTSTMIREANGDIEQAALPVSTWVY